MIALIRYLRDNLAGAFEIMMGHPEGLGRLDTSLDGFWRSFAAIVLIVPFALLALVSELRMGAETGVPAQTVTGSTIVFDGVALLVDWFAFPVVFALLARPFGLGPGYVPFIVTRNWGSVVIGALAAIVHALHLVHLVPASVMVYALLGVVAISLRLSYVIVRTTLNVAWTMALPIVILDFLVSLVVWSAFDHLI